MFSDPKYSFSVCQKTLCSNPKLIFFTEFNLNMSNYFISDFMLYDIFNIQYIHL